MTLDRERFALGLLLLAIAFAACFTPAQSDTWWQLRAGEEMWRSGHVMLHDEFTHTVAGARWPNHEWLTQVLFYKVYAAGGMPLLTLLAATAITAAWVFVLLLTPGPSLLRVALVGLAVMGSSPGWSLRPQVLTLTMCAATTWILVRRRGIWLLPPLFLVWANLHGAVALGGVIVASAWFAALLRDRRDLPKLTIVGALCLAATAMTPLGVSLWLEIPASLERLHAYGVSEWQPPQFTRLAHLPFWIAAAAVLLLAIVKRHRLRSLPALTLAAAAALLFVLGTRSERNVPPFLVVATPAIGMLLTNGERRPRESGRHGPIHAAMLAACAVGGVLGVAHAWRTPLPKLGWSPLAGSLVSAIASCPGRLYNRYDEGGYLIWFVKDRKIFLDNRQDPFPPELVLAHIEVERSGNYRDLFNRYDIGCSLTQVDSPLAATLKHDGWQELDGTAVWKVYRRPR